MRMEGLLLRAGRYSINYRRLAGQSKRGGATGVLTWQAIFLAAEPPKPTADGLCHAQ